MGRVDNSRVGFRRLLGGDTEPHPFFRYGAGQSRTDLKKFSEISRPWPALLMIWCSSCLITPTVRRPSTVVSHWATIRITPAWHLEIGTPLVFDVGVYLVVLGVTLAILLSISNFRKSSS